MQKCLNKVVAVIIAVSQFVRHLSPAKYIPIISMVLGVIAGFVYIPNVNVQEAVMNGVIVGLTANGLFDVLKSLYK